MAAMLINTQHSLRNKLQMHTIIPSIITLNLNSTMYTATNKRPTTIIGADILILTTIIITVHRELLEATTRSLTELIQHSCTIQVREFVIKSNFFFQVSKRKRKKAPNPNLDVCYTIFFRRHIINVR